MPMRRRRPRGRGEQGRLRELYLGARKYRSVTGAWPRMVAPVTHTEHLFWYKTCFRDPRLPRRQDKVKVKRFVARVLGPEWVIPTLWKGTRLPRRAARDWPRPFVLKANHGCGYNAFVGPDGPVPWPELEKKSQDWLSRTFGTGERAEWGYRRIRPRLLVEPMVGEPGVSPPEYKFHTFGGRVHFCQTTERLGREKWTRFFDLEGTTMPFRANLPAPSTPMPPLPDCLPEMARAAERLARGFPFVRVDFYVIDGRPLFSEMTFYPSGGFSPFRPREQDVALGQLWPSPPRTRRTLPRRVWSVLRPGTARWTRCNPGQNPHRTRDRDLADSPDLPDLADAR